MKKSPTESVKDTVKGVDRAVSDKLVDGIEAGRMSFPCPFPFPLPLSFNVYFELRHRFGR